MTLSFGRLDRGGLSLVWEDRPIVLHGTRCVSAFASSARPVYSVFLTAFVSALPRSPLLFIHRRRRQRLALESIPALVWRSSNRYRCLRTRGREDTQQHHHRAPCHWGTHSDIHTRNGVLSEGDRSPVVIDFGEANIREPRTSDEDRRTEIRIRVT